MVALDSKLVAQMRALKDRRTALRLLHAEAMQRSYQALIASQAVLKQSEHMRPASPR